MVQQEVAERICAKPGSRNYGALSVWCQCHASITYKLKVSPGSFSPPPKVYSAVLLFTPLSENLLLKNRHELKIILDLFFQKRRKQLGSIIRSSSFPVLLQFLEDMNINLELRPENLDPEQYQYLANKLAEWRKTQKK